MSDKLGGAWCNSIRPVWLLKVSRFCLWGLEYVLISAEKSTRPEASNLFWISSDIPCSFFPQPEAKHAEFLYRKAVEAKAANKKSATCEFRWMFDWTGGGHSLAKCYLWVELLGLLNSPDTCLKGWQLPTALKVTSRFCQLGRGGPWTLWSWGVLNFIFRSWWMDV